MSAAKRWAERLETMVESADGAGCASFTNAEARELAALLELAEEAKEALAALMRRLDDLFGGPDRSYDWREQEQARAILARWPG